MYFVSMGMILIRTEIRGMWFSEKPSLEKSTIAGSRTKDLTFCRPVCYRLFHATSTTTTALNTHINTCFYLHSLFLHFLSFSFQSSSTRNRTFQLRWFVVRRCRCWSGRHGTVRHGTGRHSNPCYLWTVTGWPPSHLPMA